MHIGIEYSCESGKGTHVYNSQGDPNTEAVRDETARRLRNLCAIVGPSRVRVLSPGNVLAAHANLILENEWLSGPKGISLLDIVSQWRGARVTIDFADVGPSMPSSSVLLNTVRPPLTPALEGGAAS